MEHIGRRAELNFTFGHMIAYRAVMLHQFEAGCMLRSTLPGEEVFAGRMRILNIGAEAIRDANRDKLAACARSMDYALQVLAVEVKAEAPSPSGFFVDAVGSKSCTSKDTIGSWIESRYDKEKEGVSPSPQGDAAESPPPPPVSSPPPPVSVCATCDKEEDPETASLAPTVPEEEVIAMDEETAFRQTGEDAAAILKMDEDPPPSLTGAYASGCASLFEPGMGYDDSAPPSTAQSPSVRNSPALNTRAGARRDEQEQTRAAPAPRASPRLGGARVPGLCRGQGKSRQKK